MNRKYEIIKSNDFNVSFQCYDLNIEGCYYATYFSLEAIYERLKLLNIEYRREL